MPRKKDKKEKRFETVLNAGLAGAASDVVSRYGSGIKEHIVGYNGVDNETGEHLKRCLKSISKSKVNPDCEYANLKQQAGFSAETKEVARQRAQQAIRGKKPTVVRTDDIPGHVNDPLIDIAKVDCHGNPIPGSGVQVKFVGSTPKAAVGKMLGKGYQKYFDNDCKIMVPKDYYDGMKEELRERMDNLREQIEKAKQQGKTDLAAQKQELLEKCKKVNKSLKKSSVSNDEAMEARVSPGWSTTKDILKTAHEAGLQQAAVGAGIGGGISLVRNAIAFYNGDKTGKDVAVDVLVDTASAAGVSYATAFGGSVIKGAMQNAASKSVRALSKSNLPAVIATSTIELGKTLKSYFSGEIDGTKCLNEIGEKGYGMINSALFTAIGQMVIPVPVLGALVGSMVGYALSSASYKILTDSLNEAKRAREERIRIERECAEMKKTLEECRLRLEEKIDKYLQEKREFFCRTFSEIKQALDIGDVDGYIDSMNKITESFGKKPLYRNMDEFNQLMESDEPIVF